MKNRDEDSFLGERILDDPPLLHRDLRGAPISLGLGREALDFIAGHVSAGSTTLETGAGVSTLLFAMKRTTHTCIVPNREETDGIVAYCRQGGIPTDTVTFQTERSELVLPRMDLPPLDLVLIDGCHGFPIPFIDWFYTAGALRVGGFLVIDDVHLWTGEILKEFLLHEPEWVLAVDLGRTVVFEKLAPLGPAKEWFAQQSMLLRSPIAGEWVTIAILLGNQVRRTLLRAGRGVRRLVPVGNTPPRGGTS